MTIEIKSFKTHPYVSQERKSALDCITWQSYIWCLFCLPLPVCTADLGLYPPQAESQGHDPPWDKLLWVPWLRDCPMGYISQEMADKQETNKMGDGFGVWLFQDSINPQKLLSPTWQLEGYFREIICWKKRISLENPSISNHSTWRRRMAKETFPVLCACLCKLSITRTALLVRDLQRLPAQRE